MIDNNKLQFIKFQLYKAYLKDDTLDAEKFIKGLIEYYSCSRDEILEHIIYLEKEKVLVYERKFNWIWMVETYAKFYRESQGDIGSIYY